MLELGRILAIGLVGAAMGLGCRDNMPPVPMVPPAAPGQDTFRREYEVVKPMPRQEPEAAGLPRPFADEPLLVDTPAEAVRFVEMYRQVGRPRVVVFVNRTLEGQLIPSSGGDSGPVRTMERTRKSTGNVTIETKDYSDHADAYGRQTRNTGDKFQSNGPAEYTDTTQEYLRPGEYDEVQAKAIDYGMMEALLTDWMSADGKVSMVSPLLARKKLSESQIKALQSGQVSMQEVAEQLDGDILIQVQARITKQTAAGLSIRILAEAVNTRGGDSLARAAVDMEAPLDKPQLNKYSRFLARKLMDQMASTWSGPGPGGAKDRGGAGGAASNGGTVAPAAEKGLGPRLDGEQKQAR